MDIEELLNEETKICPECAETIKFKARKCRYCQSELDPDMVAEQVETRRAELLAKEREGKIQCPQCEKWDVYQTMIKDGGYGDYCPNCKQSLKSLASSIDGDSIPSNTKNSIANRIICSIGITFLLYIVAMVILAFIDGFLSTSLVNTRWLTTLIGWSIFFFAFFVIMRPKKKDRDDSQIENG